MTGPWIEQLQHDIVPFAKPPSGYLCSTTKRGLSTVHAFAYRGDIPVPICEWNSGRFSNQSDKYEPRTSDDMTEARQHFGGVFCRFCEPLMKASLRIRLRELWAY